jgi:hypothetical protein
MADGKQGAYATKAADTDFRRKWDKEEYAEKARKKDDEERERMQENEERMKQGTGRVYKKKTIHYTQANHLGSTHQAKSLSKGRRKIFQSLQSS